MLPLTQKRSAVEVVDAAIHLVRQHYPTLVTVSALALAPMLLLTPVIAMVPQRLTNLMDVICAGYAEACLLLGIAAVYRGEPLPAVGAQLRAGRRIAGRVIRIAMVRSIVTWLGLIVLIVPGLFAYAYYLLGTPVAALEDLKDRPAIKRGAALAKGEYRRIILVAGLSGLLYLVLFVGITLLAMAMTGSESMALLVGTVFQIALLPAIVAITVLLYFDIRERREGVDIEWALTDAGTVAVGS